MEIEKNNHISAYAIGNDIPITSNELTLIYINNLEELTLLTPSILILCLNPKQQNQILKTLHSDYSVWNCTIYVLQESTLSPYLSDGVFEPSNLDEQWQRHLHKLTLVKEAPIDKLLAWLWLGADRKLSPLCQSERTDLYFYPLLACYFGDDYEPYHYLQLEEKRGYLEKEKTIDKIRLCTFCHSGHLNYIETCPDCKSTNIEESTSLHCFTCGKVDREDHFLKQSKLACPNCFTQLRHIGVDYDRPLELYKCGDCQLAFSESLVRARCLSCFTINEVNNLIARPISQFKVGEQVKDLMLYGGRPVEQALTLNSLIDKNSFHNLLVWVNKLAIRHKQSHLLVGVKLSGVDDFSQTFGEVKRLQLIAEISNHFNGLLRDTDICCQYSSELMLLLMPITPIDSIGIIEKKIADISADIESDLITLHIYAWSLPAKSLTHSALTWLNGVLDGVDDE